LQKIFITKVPAEGTFLSLGYKLSISHKFKIAMTEFMLLIRTEGDHLQTLSPQAQQEHIQKVMVYIEDLMKNGNLKSAQPLEHDGTIISGTKGKLKDGPFNESKEVVAGYFHIQAKDLNEAIQIAKNNPVFESASNARIEVRPIKILHGINDK
jgi:hypothetical protein